MTKQLRLRVLVLVFVGLALPWPASGQAAQQPTDAEVYARYRVWVSGKATTTSRTEAIPQQAAVMAAYRKALTDDGVPAAEADRRVKIIRENARRLEVDMWNRQLTAAQPAFNVEPNAFLVRAIKGVRPSRALDYGMGQGRNTIYLAQQGWTATGFDPAEKAVAAAQEQAHNGVGFRATMPRIFEGLKPGGLVVVEAFQ